MRTWHRLFITMALASAACALPPADVIVAPRASNNLTFLYSHLSTEFAFCAFGRAIGERQQLRVERIELPIIISATKGAVRYDHCAGVLGMGHSHPAGDACELSPVDSDALLAGSHRWHFLLCDPDGDGAALTLKAFRRPTRRPASTGSAATPSTTLPGS